MDRFDDYDFISDPAFIRGDLGLGDGIGRFCGTYGDDEEVYDDKRIDEEIEKLDAAGGGADLLVTRIYDQGREGSCVANAFAQAHEVTQALQVGRDKVTHLSAMSLYKRIGSSANSGAMVSDGIAELTKRGILPLDTPANREKYAHVMSNTGWSQRLPAGWEATAKLFLGHEYKVVRSTGALLTALCKQRPVVVGRQGHSICYLRPMRRNGRRVVKYANSWRETWGDSGFGYDSESMFRSSACWAVAVMSTVYSQMPVIPVKV